MRYTTILRIHTIANTGINHNNSNWCSIYN